MQTRAWVARLRAITLTLVVGSSLLVLGGGLATGVGSPERARAATVASATAEPTQPRKYIGLDLSKSTRRASLRTQYLSRVMEITDAAIDERAYLTIVGFGGAASDAVPIFEGSMRARGLNSAYLEAAKRKLREEVEKSVSAPLFLVSKGKVVPGSDPAGAARYGIARLGLDSGKESGPKSGFSQTESRRFIGRTCSDCSDITVRRRSSRSGCGRTCPTRPVWIYISEVSAGHSLDGKHPDFDPDRGSLGTILPSCESPNLRCKSAGLAMRSFRRRNRPGGLRREGWFGRWLRLALPGGQSGPPRAKPSRRRFGSPGSMSPRSSVSRRPSPASGPGATRSSVAFRVVPAACSQGWTRRSSTASGCTRSVLEQVEDYQAFSNLVRTKNAIAELHRKASLWTRAGFACCVVFSTLAFATAAQALGIGLDLGSRNADLAQQIGNGLAWVAAFGFTWITTAVGKSIGASFVNRSVQDLVKDARVSGRYSWLIEAAGLCVLLGALIGAGICSRGSPQATRERVADTGVGLRGIHCRGRGRGDPSGLGYGDTGCRC